MIAAYAVLALVPAAALARLALTGDPRRLAFVARMAGPLLLGLAGVVMTAAGRPLAGFPLVGAATVWILVLLGRIGPARRDARRRSTVRTAALEVDVDEARGTMEGVVLAGRYDGRVLKDLDLAALMRLRADLAPDPDSVRLLEAYLQGRFPAWRADADADVGARQARAPAPGAMTEKEAYQILGLEPGASAADIRKAHRRLVQRLGADVGRPPLLAARIDEARDVLLSLHG
jgi:hypothetical protein